MTEVHKLDSDGASSPSGSPGKHSQSSDSGVLGVENVVYLNMLAADWFGADIKDGEAASEGAENVLEFQNVQGLSSAAVNKRIMGDQTTDNVAKRLKDELVPNGLRELGIEAECDEVCRKGGFVVIQATLKDVDKVKTRIISSPGLFFACCTAPMDDSRIDEPVILKLCELLPRRLAPLLTQGNVEVEVLAKSQKDQVPYMDGATRELGLSGPRLGCAGMGCTVS